MKFIKSFLSIAVVLTILCFTANAEETKLQGLIVTKELALTPEFVNDACLRFDGHEYYIAITLNQRGQDLFSKAIKNSGDRKMALVFGNAVLASPLPIMTETFSEILVRFDDARTALDLLNYFSK